MAETTSTSILNIMDRTTYDGLDPKESNSIYFVREPNSETAYFISMYVGETKVGDILDITKYVTTDPETGRLIFNESFAIKDKLYFVENEDESAYSLYMYDGNDFLPCGAPSNVIVVDEIPSAASADNTVYVDYIHKQIAVFHNDGWQYIINGGTVGESMYNKEMSYGGNTYIGGFGSEIFNDYINNKSIGAYSHVEGNSNVTTQNASYGHAEGNETVCSGVSAHSEGQNTTASGDASHASGNNTIASGNYSSAYGSFTIAQNQDQFVCGKYNVAGNDYIFAIGNGSGTSNRSNAMTVDISGNLTLSQESGQQSSPSVGNVKAATGVRLSTVRNYLSASTSSTTLAGLPYNGTELIIGAANSTVTISNMTSTASITISDISNTYNDGTPASASVTMTSDYNSVIIIKKDSTLNSAIDIITNFSSSSASDKIYLMNPTIDISLFTMIHILLYYDGFNMCAIVAGYEQLS